MEEIARVEEAIKNKGRLLVLFSGGSDSTLLAKLAYDVLGENAVAVTIDSPVIPRSEVKESRRLAGMIGIEHNIITLDELKSEHLIKNPPDRCYLCRKLRDEVVRKWADKRNFETIADGLHHSDMSDYRPGLKAATEDGIWHPFTEFKVTKESIKQYSRALNLETWHKPSMACLASRFAYGFGLTRDRVERVEKAEEFLRGLGFKEVRVRYFPYDLASVEVDDLKKACQKKEEIVTHLRALGFSFVSLDLEGFKSGKLNRTIGIINPD